MKDGNAMHFSDEYLEFMGNEFMAMDLYRKHGIRFDTFLVLHNQILPRVHELTDLTALNLR